MSTDHNEAMRLADELVEEAERRVCHVAMAPASLLKDAAVELRNLLAANLHMKDLTDQALDDVRALTAERDQHQATATALIALLADIRKACGDNGKRMQPELVEFIGAMSTERDQLRAEVESLSKTDAEILACNYPDGEENGPTISAPDYELIGFARQLGIRDAARTTHKETE